MLNLQPSISDSGRLAPAPSENGGILPGSVAEPDICLNNHGGNPESAAANERTDKSRDRGLILHYLAEHGSATCDELEVALGMSHQTTSARCSELLRDGLVERTGQKRPTRTGCAAAILRLRQAAPVQSCEFTQVRLW